MTYQFSPEAYKKLFDTMYGQGSYDRGIQNAAYSGQLAAQAKFAGQQLASQAKANYKHALQQQQERQLYQQKQTDLHHKLQSERFKRTIAAGQPKSQSKSQPKKKPQSKKHGLAALFSGLEHTGGNLLDALSGQGAAIGNEAKMLEQSVNPFDNISPKEAQQNYHKWLNAKPEQTKLAKYNTIVNGAVNSLTSGIVPEASPTNPNKYVNPQDVKGLNFIGQGIGYLLPGSAALKGAKYLKVGEGAAKGLSKLGAVKTAQNLAKLAAEGGFAGGTTAAAQSAVQGVQNPKTLKQAPMNILTGTAIGAVGDPILHGVTKGLSKLLTKGSQAVKSDVKASAQPNIAGYLPEPQKRLPDIQKQLNAPVNIRGLKYKNADQVQVKGTPLLNEPKYSKVLKAKRTTNQYLQKFNQLIDEAKKANLPPGREYETVKGMWSSIAGPKDPSFETMLKLANDSPSISTKNKSEIIKMARENQRNAVYGVPDGYNKLNFEKQPVTHNGEGKPLQFKKTQFNRVVDKGPLNYVGKIQPPNATKVTYSQPKINDKLLNSLEYGDKVMVRKDRSEVPMTFVKREGNKVVVARKSGKNVVVPAEFVASRAKPIVPKTPLEHLSQGLKPKEKSINIGSQPPLKKLTKVEQYHLNNQDQFARNNDGVIPDTSGHTISKKEIKNPIGSKLNSTYTKTVDNLHPLNQFDKMVEKTLGKPLKPSEQTHTLGLNSRGSDMISRQILEKNMVDAKGNVIGAPLKSVTKNMNPKKLKAFEDYLINKHAITRMKRGEKVFPDNMKMSPEKSQQIVDNYEKQYPEFKNLAQKYYNYNKQLGKAWLVDTGILTKDEWNGYLKANPHYVPMNRAFKNIEKSNFKGAKRGFSNQSNPVKKAIGSQRPIISPIESTIDHTAQYVKTAKRNEVMQALVKNILKNPKEFQGFAEIVQTDKMPESVKQTLQNKGVEGVLHDINQGFDQKPDLTHGNIVTGIVDGKKVHVKVHDPQLLDALTNLSPKEQHVVIRFVGQVTRIMKNLTTGINPVFSLTRNVFRDVPQSYTNSHTSHNPVEFAKDLLAAFVDVASNNDTYNKFKNIGGGHSSPVSSDINLLAQSKRNIMKQRGVRPALGKTLGVLENLNNAIEAAPRLAEFKRITKAGGNSYDSKVKGLYEANDITTNFNKYGNATKGVDAFIPYLNAAVQGLDKLVRQSKNHPIQTAIKGAAAITLPTIVLFAVNHNNPNYKQLSNYIKDNNFLIPLPNGTFFKIPKPRELGTVFSTDIERMLRKWMDHDPKAFQDFATNIKDTFLPPTRPITQPINDLRANKNFVGAPIVPGDLQGLSPKYQYDGKTSEVAKEIGNILNVSPKQVDYLIKSYGGVIGELGLPATTKDTSVLDTLKQKVTADPVFSNDIQRNFYNEKTKLDQAHADYTKQGVINNNLNEALRKKFDAAARDMSKVRKVQKAVLADDSLSKAAQKQKVRELQQLINQIAQQTNKLAR